MKYKIILLIVFSFLKITTAFSQYVLEIEILDCRSGYYVQTSTVLKLYRNNQFIENFELNDQARQTIIVIKKGNYRIDYTTIFDKIESVYLKVTEKKVYTAILCIAYMDYSKEAYIPIIDRLKNDEEYTIDWRFNGDILAYNKENLTIRKRDDKFFVALTEAETELTEQQIEYLRRFEIELTYMNKPAGMSNDTYTLSYNNIVLKIDDGTLWWDGGKYLFEALALKKKR